VRRDTLCKSCRHIRAKRRATLRWVSHQLPARPPLSSDMFSGADNSANALPLARKYLPAKFAVASESESRVAHDRERSRSDGLPTDRTAECLLALADRVRFFRSCFTFTWQAQQLSSRQTTSFAKGVIGALEKSVGRKKRASTGNQPDLARRICIIQETFRAPSAPFHIRSRVRAYNVGIQQYVRVSTPQIEFGRRAPGPA